MTILFIRHGETKGNLEKRYIGSTDEPLCNIGIQNISDLNISEYDVIISSPLIRCLQTAEILFPNNDIRIENNFRECDFGDFEGKNFLELQFDPAYQTWINNQGLSSFPNGEKPTLFRERCCLAFQENIHKYSEFHKIAFVVHGGTIMSILSEFAVPHKDYFDWLTPNGHGWVCEYHNDFIEVKEQI